MGQTQRLGTTATSVRHDKAWTIVRYHDTDVVSFDAETIVLRTGGWKTATTKARMNQAANQFGLRYQVYQAKGQWYIRTYNPLGTWNEPITFDASGVHTLRRAQS